jgi:hypothetical protein
MRKVSEYFLNTGFKNSKMWVYINDTIIWKYCLLYSYVGDCFFTNIISKAGKVTIDIYLLTKVTPNMGDN